MFRPQKSRKLKSERTCCRKLQRRKPWWSSQGAPFFVSLTASLLARLPAASLSLRFVALIVIASMMHAAILTILGVNNEAYAAIFTRVTVEVSLPRPADAPDTADQREFFREKSQQGDLESQYKTWPIILLRVFRLGRLAPAETGQKL